jgi:hypothetical protein
MTVIKKIATLILIIMTIIPNNVIAFEKAVFPKEPVLITSLGQNPDGLMVRVVLSKIGIENDYLELASDADLNHRYHSVVMAVGVSYKGMGAAGLNYNDEINRTRKLVCEAVKKDCPIILAYFGENPGREKRTHQLIKLVAPRSDYIIAKRNETNDKYFTEISRDNKITLLSVDNLAQLENIFKNIYNVKK